jgi:hypothetical protein
MTRISIEAHGIDSVSTMSGRDVRLHSTVTSGPDGTVNREVDIHLSEQNLKFLLGCLVERDPDVFLRIADAIRAADKVVAQAEGVHQRMSWERTTHGYARKQLIQDAITWKWTPLDDTH